jgi:iron complex transport system substrate-binding protein
MRRTCATALEISHPRRSRLCHRPVLLLSALLVAVPASSFAADFPRRIVSLNVCTDQLLIDLVATDRIAALSHLAADPSVSAVAERAAGIPATRGEAETVLAFDPDLVLAGAFSTPATVAILERIGQRVVKVPLASNLDGIREAVRKVAAAVGETPRGEELIAEMNNRIARSAPSGEDSSRPKALVYQVNGLASGPGSLADSVLSAAGYSNQASQLAIGAGGTLPLETLVTDPPDLLVLTGPVDEYRTAVADNLRHPALAAVRSEKRSAIVPWRLWLCGTPHVAQAIEILAGYRRDLTKSAPATSR